MQPLKSNAPAKVNLTLRVLGKRADGYHEIASVVAFADVGDELTLESGGELKLTVNGPFAAQAGPDESNLVMKAARALAGKLPGIRAGRFTLTKNLPAGAGLGGGSSDAAAALRLLAQANDLALDDARIFDAARSTGADVSVCLNPRARLMHGVGEVLSEPLILPALPAVIVFPASPLATAPVFGALDLNKIQRREAPYKPDQIPGSFDALIEFLRDEPNDLERTARKLMPVIAEASALLASTAGAQLVRMSGSGSAVFTIYKTREETEAAAGKIKSQKPDWWVQAVTLN